MGRSPLSFLASSSISVNRHLRRNQSAGLNGASWAFHVFGRSEGYTSTTPTYAPSARTCASEWRTIARGQHEDSEVGEPRGAYVRCIFPLPKINENCEPGRMVTIRAIRTRGDAHASRATSRKRFLPVRLFLTFSPVTFAYPGRSHRHILSVRAFRCRRTPLSPADVCGASCLEGTGGYVRRPAEAVWYHAGATGGPFARHISGSYSEALRTQRFAGQVREVGPRRYTSMSI